MATPTPEPTLVNINFKVDEQLRRDFKAVAKMREMSSKALHIKLMREAVASVPAATLRRYRK